MLNAYYKNFIPHKLHYTFIRSFIIDNIVKNSVYRKKDKFYLLFRFYFRLEQTIISFRGCLYEKSQPSFQPALGVCRDIFSPVYMRTLQPCKPGQLWSRGIVMIFLAGRNSKWRPNIMSIFNELCGSLLFSQLYSVVLQWKLNKKHYNINCFL